jgi:hypothetical protein
MPLIHQNSSHWESVLSCCFKKLVTQQFIRTEKGNYKTGKGSYKSTNLAVILSLRNPERWTGINIKSHLFV